jgi:hypothetical protein
MIARWMLVLLLAQFSAVPARGDEALFLSWGDCGPAPGSFKQNRGECGLMVSTPLYCAFEVGQTLDGVLGVEIVIDVQVEPPTLPDWWRYDAGGCMQGLLHADADFASVSECLDAWQGNASAIVQDYLTGQPYGAANQARIKLVVAVPSPDAVVLSSGVVYYAARLLFPTSMLGCQGCSQSACLVLNSMLVRRLPGQPGGDVFLEAPAPSQGNWALWQDGAECALVPVRQHSWGQIKSLYR